MSDALRLGQILIEQGVLSPQQVFEICQAQKETGIPFGLLAERMFDVTTESIERAWAEQYLRYTGTLDLNTQRVDPGVLSLLHRRQAWQFQMMPIHMESTGELLIVASGQRVPRAITFAAKHFTMPVYLRIAQPKQLHEYLKKYYPMPEVDQDMIRRARNMAYDTDARRAG